MQSTTHSDTPLLQIKNLGVAYPKDKGLFTAVKNISLAIHKNESVGLVGESGSGKSTVAKAIVRLVKWVQGEIYWSGTPLSALSESAFLPYRKKIQLIFQDPYHSLNPRGTVESILSEPLRVHFPHLNKNERLHKIDQLLDQVGLPKSARNRYPAQFSGGQRQRIVIARALAVEPELMICDEPVSALDVSIQAQILNLLKDLQNERGLSMLFISHDLAVVEFICQQVSVMQQGAIVESGDAETLYKNPKENYTRELLKACPRW